LTPFSGHQKYCSYVIAINIFENLNGFETKIWILLSLILKHVKDLHSYNEIRLQRENTEEANFIPVSAPNFGESDSKIWKEDKKIC
jgi:hypothetical protein